MRAEIEIVTPAQAAEYLSHKLPNRNLNEHTAERYAQDMRDGLWENNDQGLVIDDKGQLIDGQHRCRALILSGKSIAMLVVRGVPAKAIETVDTGRARKLADILAIEGFKDTNVLATVAKMVWNYAAGVQQNYNQATKATLLAFVKEKPHLTAAIRAVSYTKTYNVITNTSLAAVLALANARGNFDKEVKDFCDGVLRGEGLWAGDPRLTLRHWAERLRSQHEYKLNSVSEPMFGAIIRAWNAFAQGKELSLIKFPPHPTRDNLEIFGFYEVDWGTVPDLRERQREAARANLEKVRNRPKGIDLPAKPTQVIRENI